jgi:monoamine oxidase
VPRSFQLPWYSKDFHSRPSDLLAIQLRRICVYFSLSPWPGTRFPGIALDRHFLVKPPEVSGVTKRHCVVIGAGLAGLAAAYRLIQNGWTVDVLEAHADRIGGRVFTGRYKPKGQRKLIYELGGEWIGNDHDRMIDLCDHFHLKLMPHRYSFNFWVRGKLSDKYAPGASPFSETSQDAFAGLSEQVKNNDDCENKDLDRIDWRTKLKKIGFSEEELDRRDLMDSTDFGESIRHTGAFVAASEYVFSNRFDEMDMKIVGGNDRLPRALEKAINAAARSKKQPAVCLNSRVKQIDQSQGGVVVTTHDGKTFPADACICAIPAHGLRKIHWDPPLPDDQGKAAEELQYARIMKTAVFFREKFWVEKNADGKSGFSLFTNRASDFVFESTFGQDSSGGILCSYAIGDKADDLANETHPDLARWIGGDVQKALNVKRKVHGEYIDHKAWQTEESIGGAYAFYRPGQWFNVRPALQRSHERVAFAGEHLSEDWQGFMEGAVETGEAAADSL